MASGFKDFVDELFAPVGGVTLRRMFGGFGVFRDGLMLGIVTGDVLYLKTDEATRPAFAAEGSVPFAYEGAGGRQVVTSYWRLPERLFDDADEFREWALAASAVAGRANKPAARRPRKSGQSRKRPLKG